MKKFFTLLAFSLTLIQWGCQAIADQETAEDRFKATQEFYLNLSPEELIGARKTMIFKIANQFVSLVDWKNSETLLRGESKSDGSFRLHMNHESTTHQTYEHTLCTFHDLISRQDHTPVVYVNCHDYMSGRLLIRGWAGIRTDYKLTFFINRL
ncbi:MAG: hypothetical protein CL676_12735 [Bdellovibrionaceae bacterium]|nr:hypothetical protein [Pseudobdellovibrionaceae bacterium]|tara:strand:+ start:849 stop:1307 length:459 start_codon:yes stop_codon:yes gene_type:complete